MVLSPAPIIIIFPQASLRSRTVGFPESGSDLGQYDLGLVQTEREEHSRVRFLSDHPHQLFGWDGMAEQVVA